MRRAGFTASRSCTAVRAAPTRACASTRWSRQGGSGRPANPDLTYIKFDEGKGFEASEADTSIAVGLAKGSDLLGPINEILAGIDDATRDELMAGAKERQPLNQ